MNTGIVHLGKNTSNITQEIRKMSNHTEEIKRLTENLSNSKDSFEKMTESIEQFCDCYPNYSISKGMPQSIFADKFGYDMQKDIANYMNNYYRGEMSKEELGDYFEMCCVDMRNYRAQQCQTTGKSDIDNTQIVSQMYEIFAKENARAARSANYIEGEAYNNSYGDDYRNDDWVYYNADYYYQCKETKEILGEVVNGVAKKWEISPVDTEEIENKSQYTLDGGFDFNSGWNFTYRNQVGRASISEEAVVPPKNFKLFYKENMRSTGTDNIGKMEMWIGKNRYSKEVLFYTTRDSLKGQIFNAGNLMKNYYQQTDNSKDYADFLKYISVFTRWYS